MRTRCTILVVSFRKRRSVGFRYPGHTWPMRTHCPQAGTALSHYTMVSRQYSSSLFKKQKRENVASQPRILLTLLLRALQLPQLGDGLPQYTILRGFRVAISRRAWSEASVKVMSWWFVDGRLLFRLVAVLLMQKVEKKVRESGTDGTGATSPLPLPPTKSTATGVISTTTVHHLTTVTVLYSSTLLYSREPHQPKPIGKKSQANLLEGRAGAT